jgi:hypothetical protein
MAFFGIQLALWMLSDRHEYARIPHTIGSRAGGESSFSANRSQFAAIKDGSVERIHKM